MLISANFFVARGRSFGRFWKLSGALALPALPVPSGATLNAQAMEPGFDVSNSIEARIGAVHSVGSADVSESAADTWIGNHLRATAPSQILEVGLHVQVEYCQELTTELYEGSGASWTLRSQQTLTPPTGDGYLRLGLPEYSVTTGQELLVGISWATELCRMSVDADDIPATAVPLGPLEYVGRASSPTYPGVTPAPGAGSAPPLRMSIIVP